MIIYFSTIVYFIRSYTLLFMIEYFTNPIIKHKNRASTICAGLTVSIYFWDHILYMIVYVTTKSVMNKQWIRWTFQVMNSPTLNPSRHGRIQTIDHNNSDNGP